jgi:hypothetical protein
MKIVNLVKAPFRYFKRTRWHVGAMAAKPYATHIPVLVACARLFRPSRILELGSGFYSTPLFLNRQIFPDVVEVCSLENDPVWFQTLSGVEDPRLKRRLVEGPMHTAVAKMDLSGFDVIFVDDSNHARHRRRTLQSLRQAVGRQVIVVHDVDQWRIRFATNSFPNHHIMHGITPQTAVVWDAAAVRREWLIETDAVIAGHRDAISEDEAMAWAEIFESRGLAPAGHEKNEQR